MACILDDGSTTARAWYEWFPAGAEFIDAFQVQPGDHVAIGVQAHNTTTGNATLENRNTGDRYDVSLGADGVTHWQSVNGGVQLAASFPMDNNRVRVYSPELPCLATSSNGHADLHKQS
ncbi:hypothetical protein BKA67DRAFT_650150 [Truncatella angustata]|uniref:Lectin n=1 Tax=Truncatella angustata TaxID=152316 RepID=A0A9P8RPH0_9PEZI|nr:uncharacterized protein BKA67DRAFT_650150 [Truncatella angustata]KAH6646945.1 hypothetical protein BKA67DRAFT_650150 [Truncatella angustata]